MIEPLVVLWEDPHGLAVEKPAGLLTQGSVGGEETLEGRVRRHLRPDDPASAYLGTVHRLDRPVSGVMLWAKNPKAARRWSEQFARRETRKVYWAIVEVDGPSGRPPSSGNWNDHLRSPDALGRARVVREDELGATQALTRFEVGIGKQTPEGMVWLELRPETGRTHQLRAQASSRGWPIVGDSTYGSTRRFSEGIALHSRSLTVEHPITRRSIVIEAPMPSSWTGWLT